MAQLIGYVLTGITVFIGILSYERVKNKDNSTITTSLAILMTKVDSLLKMNDQIKDMEEMLIRHDQKIKNLEDTNRFTKLTEQIINGGLKDD